MLLKKKSLILPLFCVLVGGCGGGSSNSAFDGEYGGVWDAQINLTLDDCGIVEQGVVGFVDVHSVTQNGSSVSLESEIDFEAPLTGDIRSDSSVQLSETVAGADLFGDGLFCTLTQKLGYTPTSEDEASLVFSRHVECDGGFICDSTGVGTSRRRAAR